jgi:hypothetical protein
VDIFVDDRCCPCVKSITMRLGARSISKRKNIYSFKYNNLRICDQWRLDGNSELQ